MSNHSRVNMLQPLKTGEETHGNDLQARRTYFALRLLKRQQQAKKRDNGADVSERSREP